MGAADYPGDTLKAACGGQRTPGGVCCHGARALVHGQTQPIEGTSAAGVSAGIKMIFVWTGALAEYDGT